ncbi:high affinity immunoglobulin epsilon receptor subunit gamma [Protopterus annectens]|uniref:high affinity immunoglobulin epsilon receptor subunit gamma n=1 Tax=Protopterus annectens TaxID=7888 RepID=UPI001CF9C73D|nr:high affinity immunoglobulin epsilon receptor subunit gamma [Protopterus annectens]
MFNILNDDSTYARISKNEVNTAYMRIDNFLSDALFQGIINTRDFKFLTVEIPVTPQILGIPKIHKDPQNPPFRPIVAARGSKTETLAAWVDKWASDQEERIFPVWFWTEREKAVIFRCTYFSPSSVSLQFLSCRRVRKDVLNTLKRLVESAEPIILESVSRSRMFLLALLLIFIQARTVDAMAEPEICYVLDAILFLYGIVLTVLYCRLKLQARKQAASRESNYEKVDRAAAGDGIYTGLSPRQQETYETLEMHKK